MMAGNPSWWSMHPPNSHQQPSALLSTSQSIFPSPYVLGSSASLPFNPLPEYQEHPQSWSQLLLGGLSGDEERFTPNHNFQPKKFENWEEQIIIPSSRVPFIDHVKQEVSQTGNLNIHGAAGKEFESAAWPQIIPAHSPRSCVTTSLTTNILDFSHTETDWSNQQNPDHLSKCNSKATGGGACKKARVQPSSSGQPPLKVRKEKLGDRITALHQLVSPFGKTDTASVLLEAIGYIRFLQGQIEALSSPYLSTSSGAQNLRNQQYVIQGDHINGAFPEDPGQLLNDTCCLKRKGALNNQDIQDKPKDLRSRGLCLVPVSCTLHVGSENGADYWAPAAFGSGF